MFLDERGRRGLIVRSLGVLGALMSAGALAILVVGVLAFAHGAALRSGSPQVLSAYARHAAPLGVGEKRARQLKTAKRPELAARDQRANLSSERRALKDKRAKA